MDYVARRARTTHEVLQKLKEKGFPEPVAENAVARLCELGYLDDEAYARSYAQRRFEAKGYGPQRIRQELRRRGVPDRYAEAALDELLATVDPLDAARRQAEKRWARLAGETDLRKRRKKLSDFLLRRGFSYDVIRQVTDELAAD
jgi:regulatory protein